MREAVLLPFLLAAAGLCAALAWRIAKPFLAYAAVFTGWLAYGHLLHRLFHPAPPVYTLAALPLILAAYALAHRRSQAGDALWPPALETGALAASVVGLLPIATEFTSPAHPALVAAALIGYGALYAALMLWRRRPAYFSGAAAALTLGYFFLLAHQTPAPRPPVLAEGLSLAGVFWLAVLAGWKRFGPRRALSLESVAWAAGTVAALSALWAVSTLGQGMSLEAAGALAITAAVFAGIAWEMREGGWGHAAFWAGWAAYAVWLTFSQGHPSLGRADWYLTPVAVYLLVASALARRSDPAFESAPYSAIGLTLGLGATLISLVATGDSLGHALLLAAESLGVIVWGLASQSRLFVGFGTLSLALLLIEEARAARTPFAWAVCTVLLGIVVLGSALTLERRKKRIKPIIPPAREEAAE